MRTALGRLNLTLLGLAILGATYWFTDQATNRQPVAPRINRAAVLEQRAARPPAAGVFVYIIDSLRHETAIDPAIMPHLAALRAEGVSLRMLPGFNSGSAASLRDAFTGRENAAVLATVATFIHTDAGVESLFHQMALAGRTTAVHSAGFFRQFGAGITDEVVFGLKSSRGEQDAQVLAAAERLQRGEFDCVIGHLIYPDNVAHEQGVGTAIYEEVFRRADALIPLIRARLPAGATLVITGDHGHDLMGRHGIGLNVPTLAVYAGPKFRRGIDLGSTPIMSHRYLLSQALDLPVTTEAYAGDLLPAALDLQRASLPQLAAGVQMRGDHLILALFGLMITGWAGMRRSGTHLKWHAIYELASAATVERHVGWLVPWIALKSLIPWVIILWMLRDRLGPGQPLPAHALLVVFCAKTLALILLTVGLGGIDTYNRIYLETASVVAGLLMLYLGVILLPRAWPRPATPSLP